MTSKVAIVAAVTIISGALVAAATAAGASSGPFTPSVVSTTTTTAMICRANGGSLSANTEADQDLEFTVTAPTAVQAGDSFDIKITQPFAAFPTSQTSSGIVATIQAVYNEISRWKLPSDLTINGVSLAPVDGNIGANADAGYYVLPANVPQVTVSGNTFPDPNFDPLTLPASKRVAIPGTTPAALFDPTTNIVRLGLLGTGSESSGSLYAGGSILQPPALTVHVTAKATVAAGTDLGIKVAGSIPAGNFAGSEPGNFPAPASITVNQTTLTSSDTTWTDPTYVNYVYTTALGGLVKVTAKAACGPGYENNTDLGSTPPDYYTGPNAIPNGTAPLLNHTVVVGIGITTPTEGAHYITGTPVTVGYSCIANDQGETYDTCTGDLPNGAALDTSTPGSYTFTVNATDAFQDPISRTIDYTVGAPLAPVANAGASQSGKAAGTVVTLDGSASFDPNGPPPLPLTYTWTQTAGPAVTLSNVHAVQPTFTVAPVTSPGGDTYQFSLTADNGFVTNSASTTVTSVASTPTVTVTKARAGGGSTFSTGDSVTLTANITNPDGTNPADYTYLWTQTGGRTTALSSTTAANPTYSVPSSGANPTSAACTSGTGAVSPTSANCPTYSVVVTRTNTAKASAAALLAAYSSSLPTRPVANAGPAQNIANPSGPVALDGSASTQAQGHAISYSWSQTAGPSVTLSSTTAQKPTFTAPAGGTSAVTYTFSLTVVDTQSPITGTGTNGNTSTAATVNITQVPDHVVASAGPNQTGKVAGNVITLDASASTDPNLQPLTYTWVQVSNGAPTATLSDIHAQKPTFTAPAAVSSGGYTAQFNVTATNGGPNPGDTGTSATPVGITVAASTPTAVVTRTPSGTVFTGDLVTLGATITNPDGTNPADYTYAWSQASGRTTTLSSTTAANPTYILPASGAAPTTTACTSGSGTTSTTSANCPRFQVVVTKINTAKASASVALAAYASSLPTRPVANAGTAQSVKVGSGTITLDGSASTQAQGHAISYTWSQTTGPSVTLSSTTAQKPTFTAPNAAANYTFSLTVVDTQSTITGAGTNGNTSTANTTTVAVSDYATPIASSGPNQSMKVASGTVTLDASGSSQADGHTLTYSWAQTAGTAVTLSSTTAQQPTFTVPNAGTTLKFRVTVTDTQNPNPAAASATSAEVVITVNDYASPAASAGPDQTVHRRDPVALDASGSSQADGHTLTYLWTQISGTAVTLSDPTAIQPTFTAPNTTGSLKFVVLVTDTQNPNPAVNYMVSSPVQIDVQDFGAPIANAGADQTNIDIGHTVTLDGSGSTQSSGHALTYAWTQLSGTAVTLSSTTAQKPTFVAPTGPVTLEFQLVVDDTFNSSAPATVFVDVNGIHGLDFSAHISGVVKGETASSPFTIQVTNNGMLTETITQANLSLALTLNSVAVPSSQYAVSAKSMKVLSHKTTNFTLTWHHGTTALHAGDITHLQACINILGDENPGNNCGNEVDPPGAIKVFAWPKDTLPTVIRSTGTSTGLPVWVTNASSFGVRPIRLAENVTVTVRVNGGAVQTTTAPARTPFVLPPNLGTVGASYTWSHAKLSKGDSVVVTACAVIPGNAAGTACWSKTVPVIH